MPPTASFTGSCVDLACSFDGSASADPDGLISSYEWDYGDGTSGTGVTSNHAYAGAGTYQVALRVTDNSGASASTTRPQSPTAPPPVTTIAADAFARTLSNGFGSADTGGPWTLDGSASKYSVDGTGRILLATAGGSAGAYLNQVSALSTNLQFTLTADKNPTGGGLYATVSGRRTTGAGDYQAKVVLRSGGGVALSLVRRIGATETAISPGIALPGLAFAGGDRLKVRMEVFGSSPTTVRAKVWKVGTVEPVAWQRSVTDSTAGFQSAGGVGLNVYMSSTSTNAPVVVRIDDLDARVP